MRMQQHILAALREEFDAWEQVLAGLSEAQLTVPRGPAGWSIKDELAHLWAWQQRSIARLEAAISDREPVFPPWPTSLDPETPEQPHDLNAWIYAQNRERPWPEMYRAWHAGFSRLLELGAAVPERELLDSTRYPWLEGHPLAFVLIASYDHHHEHLERLIDQP